MRRLIKLLTGITVIMSWVVMPAFLMAKSQNHIDKIVTVTKEEVLSTKEGEVLPAVLKIKLVDGLEEGSRFYINLEGAKWQIDTYVVKEDENTKVVGKRLSDEQMEVIVEKGTLEAQATLDIPLQVQVTGDEAKVSIDANNTKVTSQTLTFAHASTQKANGHAKQPLKKVVDQGPISTIVIEESHGGQLRTAMLKAKASTVTLKVADIGYSLEVTDEAKITGEKGFEGLEVGKENFKVIDAQHIQIQLPSELTTWPKNQKGSLKIDGIGIKVLEKEPKEHTVKATLSGEMIEPTTLDIVELANYEVKLHIENPKEVVSGRTEEIAFTLKEDIKGAIIRERPLHVALTESITIPVNEENKVEVMINGHKQMHTPIIEEGRVVGFTIQELTQEAFQDTTTFNISFLAHVPLAYEGRIGVQVEGSGLKKEVAGRVLNAQAPLRIEVEPFQVKTGLKNQQGGQVILKEAVAGALKANGELELILDTEYLELEGLPALAVTEGDVILGTPQLTDKGISIPIVGASTKPSTIVLKHFNLTLNGTVPKGRYEIACGGDALTDTEDKLVAKEFVLVEVGPKNKKEITFKLKEEAYAVNGKYHHLDVVPYLDQGRVMVPIKYVIEALGMTANQVKFNQETGEVVIYADKVIELKIGSAEMRVDGNKIMMQTATKLVQGRTMVPIGEIARALEIEVSWNAPLETAIFISYYE